MVVRVVDPQLLAMEAGYIDWTRVLRQRGGSGVDEADYRRMRGAVPMMHLRWATGGRAGMPTGPFVVWRREAEQDLALQPLEFQVTDFLGTANLVRWYGPKMAVLQLELDFYSDDIVLLGLSGPPDAEHVVVTLEVDPNGSTTVQLRGQPLTSLFLAGAEITGMQGVSADDYANLHPWFEQEAVGLPIADPENWEEIGNHAWEKQGLWNNLGDPVTAALARLKRGEPVFGWPGEANGLPVPTWDRPNHELLIREAQQSLLTRLRQIMTLPPDQQAAAKLTEVMPRPVNSFGQQMSGPDGVGMVAPFALAISAATTDPYFALALGMGTALEYTPFRKPAYDYMVVAPYKNGLDGASDTVELAAFALDPGPAHFPPMPADLLARQSAMQRPYQTDLPWRDMVISSWSRLPPTGMFRVASFAAARLPLDPAGAGELLLEPRDSGGHRPIGGGAPDMDDPQAKQWASVVDPELPIPPDPGQAVVSYAVSTQNIFGMWSQWATSDYVARQPELDHVAVLSATFTAVAPGSGRTCPATLEMDISWDWRTRSPARITLVGSMFAAALRNSPAPDTGVPAGLARSLGGGGGAVTISFAGNHASISEGSIRPMTPDGSSFLEDPDDRAATRRYRIRIPGLAADYSTTPHIGLALRIRATERIAPFRDGPWQTDPILAYAADPVPPPIKRTVVPLSSLPDSAGISHHRVQWDPQPGAVVYNLYGSDEGAILIENQQGEPAAGSTLEQRMVRLKAVYLANPSRKTFTKINDKPIHGTSLDVALPRGSRQIHLYVSLPVSAGGVEGVWPTHGGMFEDAIDRVAAPQLLTPSAPTLEIRRELDNSVAPPRYRARALITSAAGHRVQRYELFRTRVTAASHDIATMGPPIATIGVPLAAGWPSNIPDNVGHTYVSEHDAKFEVEHVVRSSGLDSPEGSWKTVWYRAAAWSHSDLYRGGMPDRSPASLAASVILPPAEPPVLTAIITSAVPGQPGRMELSWSSSAPVAATPLGPHYLSVLVRQGDGTALLDYRGPLEALPTQASVEQRLWRASADGITTYRSAIDRTLPQERLSVTVRLTDPLGRTTERFHEVPGAPPLVVPTIFDVTVGSTRPIASNVFTFRTNAPLAPTALGPYRLEIVVTYPNVLISAPVRVFSAELGAIPTTLDLPRVGAVVQMIRVNRSKPLQFGGRTNRALRSLRIRIIAPDGRYAEHVLGAIR